MVSGFALQSGVFRVTNGTDMRDSLASPVLQRFPKGGLTGPGSPGEDVIPLAAVPRAGGGSQTGDSHEWVLVSRRCLFGEVCFSKHLPQCRLLHSLSVGPGGGKTASPFQLLAFS